jgi:hypothetical protein
MSFFIENKPVGVSDDNGNTIYILARMGIGDEAKVSADFVGLGGRAINAYQLALLRHNVLRWEGPDFENDDGKTIPCTRENIDRLQPDLPLVKATLERIGELNRKSETAVEGDENPTKADADS